MAQTAKKRVVVGNPGRRKRNPPRRRLTDKQIRYFGTPAQKAALKRRHPSRRKNAASSTARRMAKTAKQAHRARQRSANARHQWNPSEIISLALNPANTKGKRSKMAATKQKSGQRGRKPRSRSRHKKQTNPARHHSAPARQHRRRRHRSMKNAGGGGGVGNLLSTAVFTIGGAVGSKLITQAVLGDKNVGFMGYAGNGLVAIGLSLLAGKIMRNQQAAKAILAGGVVQIVLRAITDFTPFGKFTSQIGMGDYQVSNFVTPQRYVDALNSAEVEIPPGWAPKVIMPPAAAAAAAPGMGAYGNGLYSAKGLYS